ncbi:hypothetical protein CDL15_Pgr027156 [Punica granatum]|uniref:E3 ubiquitin protein ligase n=1 Tax=Punica granatum TaxID=22663 RepID=A0A218XAY9_PUNGR|nr:hypothetical protein CDL15_Pgr027156 [Punica granatum]
MMGSTGDADRKRRHVSSTSPTAVAKKQPFLPISEDKKLDTGLVVYKNQKLMETVETNKIELAAREKEYKMLQEKLVERTATVESVKRSWKELINRLESSSIARAASINEIGKCTSSLNEDGPSSPEDALHSRLKETGATESSSFNNCVSNIEEHHDTAMEKSRLLHGIELTIEDLRHYKEKVHAAVLKQIPEDGSSRKKTSNDLAREVKNFRLLIDDLHMKHRPLVRELQCLRDADAQNKAEIRRLKGELESVMVALEETNKKLAPLKAEHDATKGTSFPPFNFGNKNLFGEKVRDKQRDLGDVESILRELQDQASSRLEEVRILHEERIKIFQQLSTFQNKLKNVRFITSSQPWLLLRDHLEKSKLEVIRYQTLYDKLQMEKENLAWREMELSIKNDMVDVYRRCSVVADSRMTDLGMEIQKQSDERKMIEVRMAEASKEPGRQEIITDFKALLSTFPEEMQTMQSQLSKYKEDAVDIHSLRAEVQALSSILNRKVEECKTLLRRSADQVAEIRKLKAMVEDIKQSDMELNLFLDMYRRESIDSRDVAEAKDLEYKAWARVQSLKSSLDEHSLELRVKTAIEAEATSQQRLAAAEAEIAELRQKLEASKREMSRLTGALKSKIEENEAYLSEIESIGQAYDDMQSQNQQLLQQITERDDYNIKLVLEGVKARQIRDSLLMERQTLEKQIQQATASIDFFNMKVGRMEDQLQINSEKVQKLGEDRMHNSYSLDNTQKRLSEVRKISQQVGGSLGELESQVEDDRGTFAEQQIELERESYKKKRVEEELEAVKRKVALLQAEKEGSVVQKLQQELKQYKEIVKCSICLERPKEVVITKCYHLFCNTCIQRIIETRHRKCPFCAASFGPNDVKPVYI